MALFPNANPHIPGNDSQLTVRQVLWKLLLKLAGSSLPTTLADKAVTTSGTAEPIVAADTFVYSGVMVSALPANTGNVYVGGSTVNDSTHHGTPLAAGESVFIPCSNLADIYVDVDTNGEGVSLNKF